MSERAEEVQQFMHMRNACAVRIVQLAQKMTARGDFKDKTDNESLELVRRAEEFKTMTDQMQGK